MNKFDKLYNLILEQYSWNQPNMDKPFIQKWERDQWEDRSDQPQYEDWDEDDIKLEPTLAERVKLNKQTQLYDVWGDVTIRQDDLVDGHLPFRFGTISGSFIMCHVSLQTLDGCPQQVRGKCWIGYNKNLKSLKGGPKIVRGQYQIDYNDKLQNLVGGPEIVEGRYICDNNRSLTSLIGAPRSVPKDFSAFECRNLQTIEGAPDYVGGDFVCSRSDALSSLIGGPKEVGGDYGCCFLPNLTSLKGAPKKVGKDFRCQSNKNLVDLTGAPFYVGQDCNIRWCPNLCTLKGIDGMIVKGWLRFNDSQVKSRHVEGTHILINGQRVDLASIQLPK